MGCRAYNTEQIASYLSTLVFPFRINQLQLNKRNLRCILGTREMFPLDLGSVIYEFLVQCEKTLSSLLP